MPLEDGNKALMQKEEDKATSPQSISLNVIMGWSCHLDIQNEQQTAVLHVGKGREKNLRLIRLSVIALTAGALI